jgi:hypothetical protein
MPLCRGAKVDTYNYHTYRPPLISRQPHKEIEKRHNRHVSWVGNLSRARYYR